MERATDVSLMLADCKQFRKNLTLRCVGDTSLSSQLAFPTEAALGASPQLSRDIWDSRNIPSWEWESVWRGGMAPLLSLYGSCVATLLPCHSLRACSQCHHVPPFCLNLPGATCSSQWHSDHPYDFVKVFVEGVELHILKADPYTDAMPDHAWPEEKAPEQRLRKAKPCFHFLPFCGVFQGVLESPQFADLQFSCT